MKTIRKMSSIFACAVSICLLGSTSPSLAGKPKKPDPGPTAAELNPACAYVVARKNGAVDVVVAAADLGSQVVLTESVRNNSGGRHRQFGSPAWSAVGDFVAFWAQDHDDNGPTPMKLFVARADGSQVTLVRDFTTRPGLGPAFFSDGLNWTPSGKELIYSPASSDNHIVAIDAVNGDTRVFLEGFYTGDPTGHPALSPDLDPTPGYQGFLAVSGADGSTEPDGTGVSDIFIVPIEDDSDGYLQPVDPDLFVNVTNKPGSSQFHSSWSPDGSTLAYFDNEALAVMDVATGVTRTLSPNYFTSVSGQDRPTWTSDGLELVFRSKEIELHDLAIIPADGTSPVANYTQTKNFTEVAPAWNPQWDPAGPGGR